MVAEFETNEKQQGDVHYVNAPLPGVVEENFEGYYHDHGDFMLGEVLQDQEMVYQSLQRNPRSGMAGSPSSADSRRGYDNSESSEEGNSLEATNAESQIASDEALAIALQELMNQHPDTSGSEITGTEADITPTQSSTVSVESNSTNMSTQVVRQDDDIDPDNMTYEELQSLGEAMGTQSKGLTDEVISFLETSTYKTGFFSKKDKHEKCAICMAAYKNRDKLITLPCQHYYHSSCITRWLKIKKECPVCKEEVFG